MHSSDVLCNGFCRAFSHKMNKNSLLLRMRTSFGGKEFQNKQGKCVAIARTLSGIWESQVQTSSLPAPGF